MTHTHAGPAWLKYPPCHMVMPHFSKHKSSGDMWFSQPFYSAPGGYQLCLRVCANGIRSLGEGTHVSVFVHLMKGENDHRLHWPFEHDIICGILNLKEDKNHVIKTFHFRNAKAKERLTSGEMTTSGYGHPRFLSHDSLYDSSDEHVQYLNEKCLCLQVRKVQPPK